MGAKTGEAIKRKVVRLLSQWSDPHDEVKYVHADIVDRIDISDDGEVTISLTPNRPHCPCCLLDLDALRKRLFEIKGVSFVTLQVQGIPAADKWSRLLNR